MKVLINGNGVTDLLLFRECKNTVSPFFIVNEDEIPFPRIISPSLILSILLPEIKVGTCSSPSIKTPSAFDFDLINA